MKTKNNKNKINRKKFHVSWFTPVVDKGINMYGFPTSQSGLTRLCRCSVWYHIGVGSE